MALSPGYMEDVLVLSHQFQSVLPMPQQQYVAWHYPGAKPLFLEQIQSFLTQGSTQMVFQDVGIIGAVHCLPTGNPVL